jgi:hypothetical protein
MNVENTQALGPGEERKAQWRASSPLVVPFS